MSSFLSLTEKERFRLDAFEPCTIGAHLGIIVQISVALEVVIVVLFQAFFIVADRGGVETKTKVQILTNMSETLRKNHSLIIIHAKTKLKVEVSVLFVVDILIIVVVIVTCREKRRNEIMDGRETLCPGRNAAVLPAAVESLTKSQSTEQVVTVFLLLLLVVVFVVSSGGSLEQSLPPGKKMVSKVGCKRSNGSFSVSTDRVQSTFSRSLLLLFNPRTSLNAP